MDKRSIKIGFPGSNTAQEIQSAATTWGELKTELMEELDQSFENQKVRDADNNHHYQDAAAVLPAGPLRLLVSTDKNKSGGVTKANYHKVGFSDLRTFCKKMTGFAPNGKQACIDALDKHYGKTSPKVENKKPKAKAKAAPKKAEKKASTATEKPKSSSNKKAKPTSVEDRLEALEIAVFGNAKNKEDEFLAQISTLK